MEGSVVRIQTGLIGFNQLAIQIDVLLAQLLQILGHKIKEDFRNTCFIPGFISELSPLVDIFSIWEWKGLFLKTNFYYCEKAIVRFCQKHAKK